MNRIEILREKITKLTGLLTTKKVKVTQRGVQAYVRYTKDGIPELVNIPYIPENATDEFVAAIEGFLDHEVAHVLFSSGDIIVKADKLGVGGFHNAVEDIYIEAMMSKKFPGSKINLETMHGLFIRDYIHAGFMKNLDKPVQSLLVALLRAYAGQRAFQEYIEDKMPLLHDVDVRIGDYCKKALPNINSSKEALDVALEIRRLLEEVKEPKKPEPPSEPSKDPEKGEPNKGSGETPEEEGQSGNSTEPEEQNENNEEQESSGDNNDGTGESPEQSEGEDDNDAEPPESSNKSESDAGDTPDELDDADTDSGAGEEQSDDGSDDATGDTSSGGNDGEDEKEDLESKPEQGDGEESSGEQNDPDNSEEAEGKTDEEGDPTNEEPEQSAEEAEKQSGEDSASSEGDKVESEEGNPNEGGESQDEGQEENEQSESTEPAEGGSDDGDQNGNPEIPSEDPREPEKKPDLHQDLDANPVSPPIDTRELQKIMRDFDEAMSELITREAINVAEDAPYLIYSKDFDVIEKFNADKFGGVLPNAVADMQDKVDHMVGKIQRDLERAVIAKNKVQWHAGKRSGRLDTGSLTRLIKFNDEKVFKRKEEVKATNTAIELLIDCSGSMDQFNKIVTASYAAYALGSTLERLRINYEISGFTTLDALPKEAMAESMKTGVEYSRYDSLYFPIFKPFGEKLDAKAKEGLASLTNAQWLGFNVDGECLEIAASRLSQQKEERKILIVLSDGNPACRGHKGQVRSHLKRTVKKITDAKIEVLGIGICDDAVTSYYPKNVVISNINDLPNTVMGQIRKLLTE